MEYVTYFEIGGQIIESVVETPTVRPPATSLQRYLKKEHDVPVAMTKKATREIKKKTGYDLERASGAPGRFRRAQWAMSTAAVLATADGPLPIGDAIAVVFLTGYGLYEGASAVMDIVQ